MDSGVNEHIEFEGRARFIKYFVNRIDRDEFGHGVLIKKETHVAGIMASKNQDAAKKSHLEAIKILDKYGKLRFQ